VTAAPLVGAAFRRAGLCAAPEEIAEPEIFQKLRHKTASASEPARVRQDA